MRGRARCKHCKLELAIRRVPFATFPDLVVSNNEAHNATIEEVIRASFRAGISVTHKPETEYDE